MAAEHCGADAAVSLVVLSAEHADRLERVYKFSLWRILRECGVLFYLCLTGTPVPLLGTDVVITPEVNGLRSIAHFTFFLICFYLGFIRK